MFLIFVNSQNILKLCIFCVCVCVCVCVWIERRLEVCVVETQFFLKNENFSVSDDVQAI